MRQALLERHFSDKDLGAESIAGIFTALAAGCIVVERKQHPTFRPNSLDNESLLFGTHGAAHNGNHILSAALVEFENREEPFDHNEAFSGMLSGAVEVKEHVAFLEPRRELVFLRPFRPSLVCGPSTGICNELAVLIVDR